MVRAKVATKVKKKPADFKRPKRKVGRKAPQAANVTSVAISSRRINMLEQSVLTDKGDAVTHRNLSLQDLMQQMGHYNAHIRQRALQGLRELVTTHASNVLANVSVVLERFLPTFVDEEAIVRDAAVSTWKVLVPALVAGKSLTPFAKLIAVYCCSGLTHLQNGVRQDTLRAIGALLDVAPELISVDAGIEQLGRLVENFRDLIAATQAQGIKVTNSYDLLAFKKPAASDSASSKGRSGASAPKKTSAAKAGALTLRFAALKVLHRLLASIDFSTTGTRASAGVQTSARAGTVASAPTVLLYPSPVLVTSSSASAQRESVGFWQQKSRTLLEPLLDLWLECVEGDVETLSDEYVEHMQYIIESVTVVLGANRAFLVAHPDDALCRTARRLQDQLLAKFPLFPEHNIVQSGDAYLSTWYGINVAIAKFACLCLDLPPAFHAPDLDARVFAFVVATFAKYEASDELRSLGGTHMIIRALLEVVGLLLGALAATIHAKPPRLAADVAKAKTSQHELFECFTALYVRTSPKSVTFRICTAFVLEQLATLSPWPTWALVMQWMACFGNLLGSLELAHVELGRQCLVSMISVLKQLPVEWTAKDEMHGIMANLVTFFSLTPSPVTNDSTATAKALKKPLTQFDALAADDQMHFVALIYHVPSYPVELLRALASCCKSPRVALSAKTFLMDILRQRSACLDLAHFVSFLMSSVLARSVSPDASAAATRRANAAHLALVHHVCDILSSMSLGATLAQILAPSLARHAAAIETMAPVELHTLVLLYRVCYASASSSKGVVSLDVPREMETHVLALSLHVVRTFGLSTATSAAAESAIVADVVEILAIHSALLVPLVHALVRASDSSASSPDDLAKRLRVLQALVRAAPLASRIVEHQDAVRTLLRDVDASHQSSSSSTGATSDNDDVARLIRQLQGDLHLIVVGSSTH